MIVVIVIATGAGSAAAAAAAVKYCQQPVPGAGGADEARGAEEEELALSRLRRVCRLPLAPTQEVRLLLLDAPGCNPGRNGIAAWPDRHLSCEERKLILQRVAAALGPEAEGVELRPPADCDAWSRDPYVGERGAAVVREVLQACNAPTVTDTEDGGVASVQITEDGYFVNFNSGLRLSLAQKFVILAKYRKRVPQRLRRVRVTLIDETFREEQEAGAVPAQGGYEGTVYS